MPKLLPTIAIISILISFSISIAPIDDEVQSSFPNYTHTIYSGYLDINVLKPGSMHYIYFESQDKPSTDPVIIWLAGGPGCSGLISMMQQNGPFIIPPGSHTTVRNQHAWNKQANLIYLQAPLGTGFSTNEDKDLEMNDETTVKNLLSALGLFINRHASLKKNDIYIAGSGYGAVFATKLARAIVDQNNDEDLIITTKLKIKGVLLGNPCVSPDECYGSHTQTNSKFHYEFLYTRGFLSKQMYDSYLGKCLIVQKEFDCYQERKKLDDFIKTTNTSLYNIYVPCYKDSSSSSQNTIDLGCEDQSGAITYLNDKLFRSNWNIKENAQWQPCNKTVWKQYNVGNGSYHLIHGLVKDNLKVWVYSGDMDSTIPTIGTKAWVNTYRRQYEIPTRNHWREWWIQKKHSKIDQVGGFVWELNELTVVSIKGAGFKAGYDQPEATSKVLQAFLTGTPLPRKHVTMDEIERINEL